jgi:hypothetical protein
VTIATRDEPVIAMRMRSPANPESLESWAEEARAAAGIAKSLAPTSFVPDSLKVYDDKHNFDYDATVAQIAAALLTGQELGLPPMSALRSIDVIPPVTGTPALRAIALRGLLQQRGHELWVEESTATRAVVSGIRAGTENVMTSTWTIDRAKQMNLRGFGDPKGAWQRMPTSQLVARATAEVSRWIASDALLGLPYIIEELEDEPELSPDGAGPPTTPEGKRRRGPARRTSKAPAAGTLPAKTAPPAPEGGTADPVQAGEEAAAPPPDPIGAGQRAALWAGLRKLGLTEKEAALSAVSGWIGRKVASSNDLSHEEAGTALDAIRAEEQRRAAAAAEQPPEESAVQEPLPEEDHREQ